MPQGISTPGPDELAKARHARGHVQVRSHLPAIHTSRSPLSDEAATRIQASPNNAVRPDANSVNGVG